MHRAAEHTGRGMSRITALAAGALVVLAPVLAGCGPSPAPTPTPTAAFASEEEAFAEAEKVYREYVDALNARNAGDADPDPQEYLVGQALEGDIDTQRNLESEGLALRGAIELRTFIIDVAELKNRDTTVVATACLDISDARLIGSDGSDVTPAGRPDLVAQEVTLEGARKRLAITLESEGDVSRCD